MIVYGDQYYERDCSRWCFRNSVEGAVVIELDVLCNYRGFFTKNWSKKLEEAGLFFDFVQDNHSMSSVKGTLHGIRFQKGEKAYHATNEGGYITWYDFSCEIYKQAGYDMKVIPVITEEYGLYRAKRAYIVGLIKGNYTKMDSRCYLVGKML